jgi:isopenicillin N synthase-like dioxygenase
MVQPASQTLPTLDFRRFEAEPAERASFLADLRAAARGAGFFYLVGHGLEADLIDQVLELSRRFFALPVADKLAIEMVNSPHFRGYNRAGYEHTRGKPDWREQIDIGAEKAAEPFDKSAPPWARLRGPNQWPAALPELKPALLRYQSEITALGIRVLRAFAAALGQPENAFEPIYTPAPNQLIKIIRYPGRAEGKMDRRASRRRNLRRQYRRDPGTRLQRLSARQCPSRRLAARRRRSAVRRFLPWREPRCACAGPRSGA